MARVNMELAGQVAAASGLLDEDRATVRDLMDTWRTHRAANVERDDYYLGHIRVKDLGISMPKDLAGRIDPRVDWPRKAVHALADRSVFNGFACDDEDADAKLRAVCAANQLERLYRKNLIGELKHCCGFWTVTDGGNGVPVISAYPQPPPPRCGTMPRSAFRRAWSLPSPKRCRGTQSACRRSCTC